MFDLMEYRLYGQVPPGFSHCIKDDCPLRTDCLRWVVYQHIPVEIESVRIISPLKLASIDKSNCPYFVEIQAVRYAKGFKHVFDVIPYKDVQKIRDQLITYFGQTKYYRCFREERLIQPGEQQAMQQIFEQNGFPDILSFSEYIDSFVFPLSL